jgi:hypothetical protein
MSGLLKVDGAYYGAHVIRSMRDELDTLRKLPRVNIRCETTGDGIVGTTYLDVIRVEREDDGTITAVTNHWPKA